MRGFLKSVLAVLVYSYNNDDNDNNDNNNDNGLNGQKAKEDSSQRLGCNTVGNQVLCVFCSPL